MRPLSSPQRLQPPDRPPPIACCLSTPHRRPAPPNRWIRAKICRSVRARSRNPSRGGVPVEVRRQVVRRQAGTRPAPLRGGRGLSAEGAANPGQNRRGDDRRFVAGHGRGAGNGVIVGRTEGVAGAAGGVGGLTDAVVAAWMATSCKAQGLPVKVADVSVVRDVCALLGGAVPGDCTALQRGRRPVRRTSEPPAGSTRSGSRARVPWTPGAMTA